MRQNRLSTHLNIYIRGEISVAFVDLGVPEAKRPSRL